MSTDQLELLKQQLANLQAQNQQLVQQGGAGQSPGMPSYGQQFGFGGQQMGGGPWGAPAPMSPPSPVGVSVPIKIEQNGVSVRLYLQFGPEFASPQALTQLVFSLMSAGVPVDSFQPRQNNFVGGYGNGGGFNNGGGYNGGFRRRY